MPFQIGSGAAHDDSQHTGSAKRGIANGVAGLDSVLQILPSVLPSGIILAYGGTVAPTGWVLCDGSAISRATYAALFALIGTSYGVGDGATTFNVPDFLGRTILGAGAGSGLTARSAGDKAGEESHILSQAELPAHVHTVAIQAYSSTSSGGSATVAQWSGSTNTGSIGSGTAHNTMQPFGVASYIIKT